MSYNFCSSPGSGFSYCCIFLVTNKLFFSVCAFKIYYFISSLGISFIHNVFDRKPWYTSAVSWLYNLSTPGAEVFGWNCWSLGKKTKTKTKILGFRFWIYRNIVRIMQKVSIHTFPPIINIYWYFILISSNNRDTLIFTKFYSLVDSIPICLVLFLFQDLY